MTDTSSQRPPEQRVGRRCCAAGSDGRAAARPYHGEEKLILIGKEFGTSMRFPPTIAASRRLVREWKTVAAMVRCYCRDHHDAAVDFCPECAGLLAYATLRLDRCRFGPEKPTCANCPVHCYQRDRRDRMKTVMRYAGPRMLWRHPILGLCHWLDGFRKAPPLEHEAAPAGNI
jgi:hypothetical protein